MKRQLNIAEKRLTTALTKKENEAQQCRNLLLQGHLGTAAIDPEAPTPYERFAREHKETLVADGEDCGNWETDIPMEKPYLNDAVAIRHTMAKWDQAKSQTEALSKMRARLLQQAGFADLVWTNGIKGVAKKPTQKRSVLTKSAATTNCDGLAYGEYYHFGADEVKTVEVEYTDAEKRQIARQQMAAETAEEIYEAPTWDNDEVDGWSESEDEDSDEEDPMDWARGMKKRCEAVGRSHD